MKRPLTVSGFAFGAGAFIVSLFDFKIALFLCALLIITFIVCFLIKKFRKAAVLTAIICFALGVSIGGLNLYYIQTSNVQRLNGASIENAAFIPEEYISRTRAVGQLTLSENDNVTVLVSGAFTEPYAEYRISGTLEKITGQYESYYLAR